MDQTILAHDPRREGNCLAACVATWFGRGIDQVPHFVEYASDRPNAWWDLLVGYMSGAGYWPFELADPDDANPGEIVFVMGMTPRGVLHQVLYRDGQLWHDPHPSKSGVTDVREVIAWRLVRHDHLPTPQIA